MITPDDFLAWKEDQVTKLVLQVVAQRIDNQVERLAISAGLDPSQDRFNVGYIAALRDILNIGMQDAQEETENI